MYPAPWKPCHSRAPAPIHSNTLSLEQIRTRLVVFEGMTTLSPPIAIIIITISRIETRGRIVQNARRFPLIIEAIIDRISARRARAEAGEEFQDLVVVQGAAQFVGLHLGDCV